MHPAGPAAAAVAQLWWVMLAGGTMIFLFVMALLVAAFRRGGDGGEDGHRIWLVGLGLAFPLSVLAALLLWGLGLGERFLVAGQGEAARVQAEARQWAWTFRYPGSDREATDRILVIPAGRPVEVEVTSADVVHSFWVPRLAGKLDAIPGRTNVLRLQADAPGDYRGLGAEFNGAGYAGHRFTLRALGPEDWEAFLAGGAP